MEKNGIWVLVANSRHAKLYRSSKFPKLEEFAAFEHPESRLPIHELEGGSKPGRSFESSGPTRHAYQRQADPKTLEAEKFAKELSGYLGNQLDKGEFLRLYLVASPGFLGLLRHSLTPRIQTVIKAEISKDLTEQALSVIEQHLSDL